MSSRTAQEGLGRLVRSQRQRLALSVRAAAEAAGIDRATWTSLEAGTRHLRDRSHSAIEDVLQWPFGSIAAYLENGIIPGTSSVNAPTAGSTSPAIGERDAPLVVRMSADELAELIMSVQEDAGREAADQFLDGVKRKRAEWAAKRANPKSGGGQAQAG